MTTIDKGYYCIHLQDSGDVTLRLKEEFLSPANLIAAALDFLSEHPDMFLGTCVEHSKFTNIIQAVFISNGRLDVQFHTKKNSAAYEKIEGYRLLDHATLQHGSTRQETPAACRRRQHDALGPKDHRPQSDWRGAHLLIQDAGLPDQSWSQRIGASLPTLGPSASHRSCKHVSQRAIGSPVPGSPI
jgi:hypothetical protein